MRTSTLALVGGGRVIVRGGGTRGVVLRRGLPMGLVVAVRVDTSALQLVDALRLALDLLLKLGNLCKKHEMSEERTKQQR